ncbi:MAG: winged helix-turn-helix transcriptional regulator [Fervidicoccaceae archaeon]
MCFCLGGDFFAAKDKEDTEEKEIIKEEFLDERDRAIISLLRERGLMTPGDLIKATGIPRSAFYRRINRLKKEGIIEQISIAGKIYYRLKEK